MRRSVAHSAATVAHSTAAAAACKLYVRTGWACVCSTMYVLQQHSQQCMYGRRHRLSSSSSSALSAALPSLNVVDTYTTSSVRLPTIFSVYATCSLQPAALNASHRVTSISRSCTTHTDRSFSTARPFILSPPLPLASTVESLRMTALSLDGPFMPDTALHPAPLPS